MAEQSRALNGITVKLNVDVSEALTGLKALQREAKRATAALREVEAAGAFKYERIGDYETFETGVKDPVGMVVTIPQLSITVRDSHDIDEIARSIADKIAGARIVGGA